MDKPDSHPDVEYAIVVGHREIVFDRLDAAAPFVLSAALAEGGAVLDVLVHSEAGAEWYGGDDAVALYQDDPDVSVFDRIEVRVHSLGRVA